MPELTREELEDMTATLKEAFLKARQGFAYTKNNSTYDKGRQRDLAALGATATALLKADERLREVKESSSITKPALPLPAKN